MQGSRQRESSAWCCRFALTLLCLAICMAPLLPLAQTSSETRRDTEKARPSEADRERERQREARERREREQARQKDAAERRQREAADHRQRTQAQQREAPEERERSQARDRQSAAERRDREEWERREIKRRQDEMREADADRAALRANPQPARAPTYSQPRTTTSTSTSETTCSAHPTCPSASGYGNVCKGVQQMYSGANATGSGMRDIVSRCQAANMPELCAADYRGDPSGATSYRLRFGGGCAQQCASVARCSTAASR